MMRAERRKKPADPVLEKFWLDGLKLLATAQGAAFIAAESVALSGTPHVWASPADPTWAHGLIKTSCVAFAIGFAACALAGFDVFLGISARLQRSDVDDQDDDDFLVQREGVHFGRAAVASFGSLVAFAMGLSATIMLTFFV